MLCEDCKKNEACVHFTRLSPEGRMEKKLCMECAAKYGGIIPPPDTQENALGGLMEEIFQKTPKEAEVESAAGLSCPRCSMTYDDFAKNGQMGCSVCYETFSDQLLPLIARIHGSGSHLGKVPRRAGGDLGLSRALSLMKERLSVAVKSEEYEEAARLRDEIREMERRLSEVNAS